MLCPSNFPPPQTCESLDGSPNAGLLEYGSFLFRPAGIIFETLIPFSFLRLMRFMEQFPFFFFMDRPFFQAPLSLSASPLLHSMAATFDVNVRPSPDGSAESVDDGFTNCHAPRGRSSFPHAFTECFLLALPPVCLRPLPTI